MTTDTATRVRAARVVLCDDHPDFLRLMQLLLSLEPALEVVGTAGDGQEAIDVCAELRPDVLVLDVSMPVLDGIAALPAIKEQSPDARVVMLSGFSSTELKERALAAGAAGFIEKGASASHLPKLILEYCA